ncbi:AAA family ATPase [Agreia sp. COWG]|uniref:AAA family ATPase n=1 Tax=Agreia sp. COWG TaxID=2773266 RepID=UPI001AF4894C|nr:AAA family ATPase [Agreia sp. COWG]CAD6005358.1 TrwC domain-containing protein [Agreia sp. COWG]
MHVCSISDRCKLNAMRGGVRVWRRGSGSRGVGSAVAYAFEGTCDASQAHAHTAHEAVESAAHYAGDTVTRWTVEDGQISGDTLTASKLRAWIDGRDPLTDETRGRADMSEKANLIFDSTINTPKSFSIAAMLNPELALEFSRLQDRLRDRVVVKWQTELNARRGAGSKVMESLARVEVVELNHERSRSLDPHSHRHLWLNAKVQGADGKWSNVDSAVMMKFQPIVNGEGELAARTDPEWIAALNENGLTLNAQGEIAELAHLVRPMSRRSNQIEANRSAREAEWRALNPDRKPSPQDVAAFDAWAWAKDRPNKPGNLDELTWAQQVRDEIAGLDPQLGKRLTDGRLTPTMSERVTVADLDRDRLAAQAVAWADARSARSNDRFSLFDLRAGAAYMVAASGVVTERSTLDELLEDVTERAVTAHTISLSDAEYVPAHVKSLRSTATVQVKLDLEAELANLAVDGPEVPVDVVGAIAAQVSENPLDAGQLKAAQLIAGQASLVTVTGPAGTGKTTILQVVKRSLDEQGRRLLVVAPSKKAANVAGEAIGGDSSSVHALIRAYGWRWQTTPEGEQWTKLNPGDTDPTTGAIYRGVPEEFVLRPGDRIVVDEAGMMDLYTARAVAQVAASTGAGIAMVGDHLQLNPVGHSGAMALAHRMAPATAELSAVHRFRTTAGNSDVEYAALSLRLRDPKDLVDATAVVDELAERNLIVRVDDDRAARDTLVDRWFTAHGLGQSIAITTSTNEEAQAINDEIQRLRIERGQLELGRAALGQHDQRLMVGDRIQTRKNDREAGVANRDDWTILSVKRDGSVRAMREGELGNEVVTLDAEYLADSAHLAYASTAHGIQGTTVDVAITGPGVTGAGLYVGMTRGKRANEVVVAASSDEKARVELAEAIVRGRIENTLEESKVAVEHEVSVAAKPADRMVAAFTDRVARPFGREQDLAGKIAAEEASLAKNLRVAERTTGSDDPERQSTNRAAIANVEARTATLEELRIEAALRDQLPVEQLSAEAAQREAVRAQGRAGRRAAPDPQPARISTKDNNLAIGKA